MTDNERKESISALRQLLAMCDFVDQYGDSIDADPYFNAVETAIESLNETVWIPVSERLPEVDVEVITTTDWSDVLIAWLNKDGAWETEEFILTNDEILAWMPLPEPWKDGEA